MKNLNLFKKLATTQVWIAAFFATIGILTGLPALAQTTVPEKVDVNISAGGDGASGGGGGWYAQPWVWVVGVAVFIIIIIAITRSGNTRRDV